MLSKSLKQKGAALYLSIVVLSIITSALLSMLAVVLTQSSAIWTLGNSVFAFYGADSGIERMLYKVYQDDWLFDLADLGECVYPDDCFGSGCAACSINQWDSFLPEVETRYQVCVSDSSKLKLWSTGDYRGTRRKIQINFE